MSIFIGSRIKTVVDVVTTQGTIVAGTIGTVKKLETVGGIRVLFVDFEMLKNVRMGINKVALIDQF